ncbi:hypothetical protein NDU88_000224 [Pleurodeles waltl]|uniref:Uncharacterized protein n=1 Tax=Pleurodeles waltl TaxID=8319 RepID=A0AAV7N9N0_PLEWA|nr:hypothetical protein NDU88_000224 [Pleurodeles waltl]
MQTDMHSTVADPPHATPNGTAPQHNGPHKTRLGDGFGTGAQRDTGEKPTFQEDSLESSLATHSRKFDKILTAIRDIETTLEPKIDALRIDIELTGEDRKNLKEQVETTEFTLSSLGPSVANATPQTKALQDEVTYPRLRADDQEGRSRHNNVCIVGVTEGIEGPGMELHL